VAIPIADTGSIIHPLISSSLPSAIGIYKKKRLYTSYSY
jgi:hypothetical protein